MPDAGRPPRSFDRSIVEGPLPRAVWMLAWPTMLQNMFGGLQGIVDHIMVGHFVGYTGNAAIGVSWQIFLVVVVFVSSLFTGTAVLVSRFAGAGNRDMVNRTVYQAFITALALSALVAPLGYLLAPRLLDVVNAAPAVKVQALPYLRIMFVFSVGMMLFFMLGVALRSAGDARTPLRLGIWLTLLNIALNTMLISGLGPFPRLGTTGAAVGTVISGATVSGIGVYLLFSGRLVIQFKKGIGWKPDWGIIRELFRFGVPSGFQAVAMNVAGVLLLRFVGSLPQSAQAQAAYAVAYTELFSLVTWTSQGLLGATAAVAGQNLGAGKPDRSARAAAVASRIGLGVAAVIGVLFLTVPRALLAIFGMHDPVVVRLGTQLMTFLSVSGLFIAVALAYTGGLQGTGDTKSPFYISVVSQMVIPLGICAVL
jgi:MATE family, multidrug efflux pump